MSHATAPDLADFDTLRPASLEPALWDRNLAALAAEDAAFAASLQEVPLPSGWQPAWAVDGFLSFRIEARGQPPTWLGETAAPLARARGVTAELDAGGRNVALPLLGAGAELCHLLERLPPQLAIFIFESDWNVLAAVLRAHDLSRAIAGGRCVLLRPDDEAASLESRLESHPGLLPPANIVLPELASPRRVGEIKRICETVGNAIHLRRGARLRALVEVELPAVGAERRLAVLALRPQPADHFIAGCLQRAARQSGWKACSLTGASPYAADALAHCEELSRFEPASTVCVNHARSALPLPPVGHSFAWYLDESTVPERVSPNGGTLLAGSPRVTEALRRAGAETAAVHAWYAACEVPDEGEPEQAGCQPNAGVLIVGDLPDDKPRTYRIDHSAHQRLWNTLRRLTAKAWETPRVLQPHALLASAERESGARLTDAELREMMLRLIERVLVPSVTLEQIARVLEEAGHDVLTLGHGWQRVETRHVKPLAGSLTEIAERRWELRPRACVFAGQTDPLTPTLLHAASAGWPLILHDPGGRTLSHALGGVLKVQEHFESFADTLELRRALQLTGTAPSQPVVQRIERARRHVRAKHSYQYRIHELARLAGDARC